jgi:hypothetical protein
MVVVLIRWYIKKGKEQNFINFWEGMQVPDDKGLHRETLTKEDPDITDPKMHTFDVEGHFYTTFINVGMWETFDAFENAITKPYIKPREVIDGKEYIQINDFEYKLRERIVLKEVSSRGGDLPIAKLKN